MSYSVTVQLDTRSKNKENRHPIKLVIVLHRVTSTISTGIRALASEWKGQKLKSNWKGGKDHKIGNHVFTCMMQKAEDFLCVAETNGRLGDVQFSDIRSHLKQGNTRTAQLCFFDFTRGLIQQMETDGKYGNARVYTDTLHLMELFLKANTQKRSQKSVKLGFKEMTPKWLQTFERWYYRRNDTRNRNGLGIKLRTIRAIYNKAIAYGHQGLTMADYPFAQYKIKKSVPEKRAITESELKVLRAYTPKNYKEQLGRDVFLVSFYLRGMNFVDLAHLKYGTEVKKSTISYTRQKTGTTFEVPVLPVVQDIFESYKNHPKRFEQYVLPIINTDNPVQQTQRIKNILKGVNYGLGQISLALGFDHKITTYAARHTYATLMKYKGMSIGHISDSLGHADQKTTEIYLDSFQQSELNMVNQDFFDSL